MFRVVMMAMALALLAAACGDTDPEPGAEPTAAPTTAAPTDEAPDDPVDHAIADFAAQAGVDPVDVEVVAHEEVTWRDGSLGCPEPGMSYTQALVDGYRIVLRAAEGDEAFYHGAAGEPPLRCEDPAKDGTVDGDGDGAAAGADASGSPESEEPSGEEAATKEPANPPADPPKEDEMDNDGPRAQAIADLANETGVDPSEIDVVAHEQVTWRDGSLGCPESGMMYTQALVDGYRIVLRANGQDVSYHGQAGKAPFRCDNPDPNGAVSTHPKQ